MLRMKLLNTQNPLSSYYTELQTSLPKHKIKNTSENLTEKLEGTS